MANENLNNKNEELDNMDKNLQISDINNSLSHDEQKELCKQLRVETGYGLMDCKRALSDSKWDIEKAKDWLRQFRKRPYILY